MLFPHWNPGLCGPSCSPVVPPGLSARKCGTAWSASRHCATLPLHPSFLSLPLLQVWMNVSSLTTWLSDFHTVRFSGRSGFFFVFKFVVVLFWLCEEAKLFTYASILSMSPMYGLSHVLKAFYSFSLRRS